MSSLSRLRGWWERHWFAPAPLLDLAVVRVLVVGMHLVVMLFPYAVLEYPIYGMLEHYAAAPDAQWNPEPLILRLFLLPAGLARPTLEATLAVYWITLAVGIPALLGWHTRTACGLFALGNLFLSAYSYSFGEHHHTDALTCILLCALALAPSGARLSLDARRAARRGLPRPERSDLARWPLELTRWMFALSYLSAAVCKLGASGLEWANGYTLQYYALQEGTRWNTWLGPWLADHHTASVALSWFALLLEGTFWIVLLLPRAAWIYVPAAIAFHAGIYASMRAPFWLYLPLYAVFVPWSRFLPREAPAESGAAALAREQPAT